MAINSTNLCIIFVLIVIIVAFIFFLNCRNRKNNVPNKKETFVTTEQSHFENNNDISKPQNTHLQEKQDITDDIVENIISDYQENSDINVNDIISDEANNLPEKLSSESDSNKSPSRKSTKNLDFIYKKKKYTHKSADEIEKMFDVDKYLPQQKEEDWFPDEPEINTKRIKNKFLAASKNQRHGINTVMGCMKNPSFDIRGDIVTRRQKVLWGNSSIEPKEHLRGLCG